MSTRVPSGSGAHVSVTVAVLGLGGVGGMVAARVAAGGHRVVCVGTPATTAAIRSSGIELRAPGGVLRARPESVERLDESVSLLVIAVKEPDLAEALERVEVFAVADAVVLTLLNGLEHPAVVRRRLGPRVAPGSISRYEGFTRAPGSVVQTTRDPLVTAASDDLPRRLLAKALEPLSEAGIEVVVVDDERAVLWEKAARSAPLAAATVASGATLGELRDDPAWWDRLEAAIGESCAVATADGVPLTPASQLVVIDAMPATLTTSTARDKAAGRPSELDAITGSVVRAARRLHVACPELERLFAEAQAA